MCGHILIAALYIVLEWNSWTTSMEWNPVQFTVEVDSEGKLPFLYTWRPGTCIRQALINNWYLRGVLQHHATPARPRPTDDQTWGPVVTLPYVRLWLSEAVRRVLAPLAVRVSFCLNTTLRQLLVRPKDSAPTEEQVYQVLCASRPTTYK